MKSNSALLSKQPKMKIDGFRFFQETLNVLKKEALDASAMSVYLVLVSECDEAGLLPSDFNQAQTAEKIGIPRQTCSNGLNQLLDRELVRETIIGGKPQLEIVGYAENNLSRDETFGKTKDLNYFNIPNEVFHSTVIANLVSHKETKGFLLMLDLFNYFHRSVSQWGRDESHFAVRRMDSLKDKLGKSCALRVRKTLDILSPLFTFKPVDQSERKPRDLANRVKKAVTQIWIKKYHVFINPACLIEKPPVDVESMKAIKDATYRIKALNITTYQKDKTGIRTAYRSIIGEVAQFIPSEHDRMLFLRGSMQSALEDLETFMKTGAKLKSVGSFLNKKFQEHSLTFLKESKLAIEMANHYIRTGSDKPFILNKYEEEFMNL